VKPNGSLGLEILDFLLLWISVGILLGCAVGILVGFHGGWNQLGLPFGSL
jgi:hypothetical protein